MLPYQVPFYIAVLGMLPSAHTRARVQVPARYTTEVQEPPARSTGALFAVVTGMEHSGTTVLSSLIKNAPGVFGGFECGFLLAPAPAKFDAKCCRPWDAWIRQGGAHMWNVSAGGLRSIRSASGFDDMYARLIAASPTLRAIPNVKVLDKTPAYIRRLTTVLNKVPGVPCVVSVKGNSTNPELLNAQRHHASRILVVEHEQLVADPHGTMRQVFGFLRLHWLPSYLSMRGFVQQLALSHSKCGSERIAGEYAFRVGAHTPGSKGRGVAQSQGHNRVSEGSTYRALRFPHQQNAPSTCTRS